MKSSILAKGMVMLAVNMITSKKIENKFDKTNLSVTVLFTGGYVKGADVFYILTEAFDKDLAKHLTMIYSLTVAFRSALQLTPPMH